MDFLGDVAKETFQPGDSSPSLISDIQNGKQKPQTFEPSDVPGFLHPLIDGKPDTSQYITPDQAEQAQTSGVPASGIPREQALTMIAKNDGIQNPTDKEAEAALEKRKKGKAEPKKQESRFDYPIE